MNAFFDSSEYLPHGSAFLWRPEILWLHVVCDLAIAFAYFSIPLTLIYVVRKRTHSLPSRWITYMFSAFIMLSGMTHVMAVITIWVPVYFWEGLVKAATASISLSTAILFIPLAPRFLDGANGEQKEQ